MNQILVLRAGVKALCALLLLCLWSQPGFAAPVPGKLRDALKSSSNRVQVAAIVAISKSGADDARPLLESMLSDREPVVRAAAVEGLERMLDPAALPAIRRMLSDKGELVRKVARNAIELLETEEKRRASQALFVDVSDVRNSTGRVLPGAVERFRDAIAEAVKTDGRKQVVVVKDSAVKGYGLLLKLQGFAPFAQDNVKGIQIDCDMTVVQLPGKSLRMTSSATTGAGTTATLDEAKENELALDAIDACAPELARDFVDYLIKRGD